MLGVGIGVLAQPQLVVRFMTAKDNKSLNRAVLVGGPFILMMTGVAFTVGALSNVYFYQTSGKIAIDAAGGNVDAIMPLFINQAMPDIFVVIFMLTLLAAAMSTLSATLSCDGDGAGLRPLGTGTGMRTLHEGPPGGIVIMMVVSTIVAFLLPSQHHCPGNGDVHGPLCLRVPAGIRGRRAHGSPPDPVAAKASFLTGSLVWLFWTVFVHMAEAKPIGISQTLFGVPTLLGYPWKTMDPLVMPSPPSRRSSSSRSRRSGSLPVRRWPGPRRSPDHFLLEPEPPENFRAHRVDRVRSRDRPARPPDRKRRSVGMAEMP